MEFSVIILSHHFLIFLALVYSLISKVAVKVWELYHLFLLGTSLVGNVHMLHSLVLLVSLRFGGHGLLNQQ